MLASLPENETARLRALQACRILDTPPEQDYDDIVRLAAEICGVPIAAISLIDSHRQQFKSIVGVDLRETPREYALCAHTILQNDVLIIPDLCADPRSSDNPFVTQPGGLRFYAGAPILTSDGFALGSLCVVDVAPREITHKQIRALQTLARQISSHIELGRRIAEQNEIIAARDKAADELAFQHGLMGAVAASAADAIFVYDGADRITFVNAAAAQMFGWSREELMGSVLHEILHHSRPDGAPYLLSDCPLMRVIGKGETLQNHEDIFIHKSGAHISVLCSIAPVSVAGRRSGSVVVVHDITEQKRIQETIRQSHHQLRLALQSGRFGTWVVDAVSGANLDISATCKEHFGFGQDAQVTGYDLQNAIHPDDRARIHDLMIHTIDSHEDFTAEYRCVWPDNSEHWIASFCSVLYDPNGNPAQLIGITHEITDRKRMEQEPEAALLNAQERADRDPLTGLYNHRAFQKRLEQATDQARLNDQRLLVVMLDLDNFKFFNEVYGHGVGDDVLCQIAARLEALSSAGDILGRFGGDEFAILLPNVGRTSVGDIESILRRGLEDIAYLPPCHETPIPITVSLGTATYPEQGLEPGTIIEVADQRLRRAKSGSELGREVDDLRTRMTQDSEGFSMLDALVTSVDNKDRYTRCHSEDVLGYSLQIGRALGLDAQTLETLAVAALIHDVGKIGVPDHILRKPGALTDAEFEAVKKHPTMGAIMVETVPGLQHTLDAVRHHHERWDGRGYPSGLAGHAIPLIARIMAVADAFSAMTTDRPYRKGMEIDKAASILKNGAGAQWDADCVDAFLNSHPVIRRSGK